MIVGAVFFVLLASCLSQEVIKPNSYGSACTPVFNPFTNMPAVPQPKVGCGSCIFANECTQYGGRAVTNAQSRGCEMFIDPNILCCTNTLPDDNACQLDPSIPVFRPVTGLAPLTGSGKTKFSAGSLIVTKASLKDTPQRYWAVIDDAVATVAKTPFPPQLKKGALYRVAVECPNIGFTPEGDPWREINIDPEQSEVNIIGDPNNEHSGGVEIKAAFDIHIRCRYSIRVGLCDLGFLCFEECKLDNSVMTLSHAEVIPIRLQVTYDPLSNTLVANPTVDLSLKWDNFEFSCGNKYIDLATDLVDKFTNFDIKALFAEQINLQFEEAVQGQVTAPEEYRPIESLIIGYGLQDVKFKNDEYIKATAVMNISAVFDDGTRKYYEFPEEYHDLATPSDDFDALLVDKSGTPLLNGLRLNVDALTAASGAIAMLFTSFANTTKIVDAEIAYNISISGPELSIPERNVIRVELPYGRIYSRCNSEPNVNTELINLRFNNVFGTMGLEYQKGDSANNIRPGVVLQYKSLNISNTKITIESPPLPVDGNVLQNAVESAMADRQVVLNDFLRERPIQLPAPLLPYFPHPRLRASPLPNAGGFIEFLTMCNCNEPPPMKDNTQQLVAVGCEGRPCEQCVNSPECSWCDTGATITGSDFLSTGDCATGTTCLGGLAKPLRDSAKCPPLSGGFEDGCRFKCSELRRKREAEASAAASSASSRSAVAQPRVASPALDLLRFDLRKRAIEQAAEFLVIGYSNSKCSVKQPGSLLRAMVLADTNGECRKHPAVFHLSTDSNGPYYSIKPSGDSSVDMRVACSRDCKTCALEKLAQPFSQCVSSSSGGSPDVSWSIQKAAGACLGGSSLEDRSGIRGLFTQLNDDQCQLAKTAPRLLPETAERPIMSVSLGLSSDAGALAACADFDPKDAFRSSFAKMMVSGTGVSGVKLDCMAGCMECATEIEESIAFDTCVTPAKLREEAMKAGKPELTPSYYVADIRTCTFEDATNATVTKRREEEKKAEEEAAKLSEEENATWYLGILIPVLICLCFASVYGCISCPQASGIVDKGVGSSMTGFKAYMSRHSWTFGRPVRGYSWLYVFNLLTLVVAFLETIVWTATDAINIISNDFFYEEVGVPDRFVQTEGFTSRFQTWQDSGSAVLWVFTIGVLVMLLDNMTTRHHHHDAEHAELKRKTNFGTRARKNLWFLLVAFHALMLLGLPLQVAFGITQSVNVTSDGSSTIEATQDIAAQALGLGAGLIMFNIILNFFVNLLQLMPAAIVCGTVLYIADKGTKDGGPGVIVSRGVWVTAALVNVTVHLIIPVALSPAVLIGLHQIGMHKAWWIGIVWLIQWVLGLLFIGLAHFRRISLTAEPGYVRVQSHFFLFCYMLVIIVTSVMEIFATLIYATELNLQIFLVLFRLTTFFLVSCFTRIWLEAYRPKWARRHLTDQRKDQQIEAARAEVEQFERMQSQRRGERFDEEDQGAIAKFCAPICAGLGKCAGYAALPVMGPLMTLSYLVEGDRPATDSLPHRRTWFFMGCLFACIFMMDTLVKLVTTSPKEDAITLFNSYEDVLYGITWPDDENGGAIFDPAFNLYNALRWIKYSVFFLCILLLIVLLVDDFRASRVSQAATQRSTTRSQQAGFVILAALYLAALAPSVPDYPAAASLTDLLPQCGYKFNELVQNVYGGIMGFLLTAFTMTSVLPVLLILMPSLLRSTHMIIASELHGREHFEEHHGTDHSNECCCLRMNNWQPDLGPAPPGAIDYSMVLYQMGAVFSPLVTGIPMLFFFVFFGNQFMIVMFLINWIGPIIVVYSLPPSMIEPSYYLSVWGVFFATLIAVILEQALSNGWLTWEYVLETVQHWSFYMNLVATVAEICLANVIVSDVVYILIWSLYPEYSVLAGEYGTGREQHFDHGLPGGTVTAVLPDGTLMVHNPVAHNKAKRATQKIRELDNEFGNELYGKVPDAPPTLAGWDQSTRSAGTVQSMPTNNFTMAGSGMHTAAGSTINGFTSGGFGGGGVTPMGSNPGGAFQCSICANSYPTAQDLELHIKKRHEGVADSYNPYDF